MEIGEKQIELMAMASPRPRVASIPKSQNKITPARKNATAVNKPQKRVLVASENKTNICIQLRDLLVKHRRHLFGHSCCTTVMMIGLPLLLVLQFFVVSLITKDNSFPNFNLEKLKHPNYNVAYLHEKEDEFYADIGTSLKQQLEFESFFQFANYTNTFRKIGSNGDGSPIKVNSYLPSLDLTGPSNWLPMQCYASVDWKYNSTVIGIIKNGNQLEEDLLTQVKDIFKDQTSIGLFGILLEEFSAKLAAKEPPAEEGDEEEEDDGGGGLDESNIFVIDPELLNTAGGGPISANEVDATVLGQFTYKEFETVDELFEYTQQVGYGWDPEIPSVCFAFSVTENDSKNKYEVEWLYRDQWPHTSATQLRTDLDAAPISNNQYTTGYSKGAYNGPNLMQVFAANSILQRKLEDPDAQIVMFTIPYQIKLTTTSPLNIMVKSFTSIYFVITVLPLLIYTVFQIAREKETGMRQLLFANGLSPAIHFLSWLLFYTTLNIVITVVYVVSMKIVIYKSESVYLFLVMAFLAIESLFGFIWALQPFFKTTRMAIFVTFFFLFLSFSASYIVDQKEPTLATSTMEDVAIAPLTAVKLTFDTLGSFHYMILAMNFDNYELKTNGWSIKIGISMFIFNFFLWTAVGIIIDLLLNNLSLCFFCKKQFYTRKVYFENTNEGVVQISALQERDKKSSPLYEFTLQKSRICCLVGNDNNQKTRLLDMIAGERKCTNGGSMMIRDSDFFARDRKPTLSEFLVYRSSEVTLDDTLRGVDHLNIFAHLRGNQKNNSTRDLCHKLLPKQTLVEFYSESQRQLLQTLIALSSENSRIVLLNEPTHGLDPEQRSELIKAMRIYKKHRYLLIQSSDSELINIVADSVVNVTSEGAEIIDLLQFDHLESSYSLIVEVEGGKPSDNLVCYLSQDISELILEYTTNMLTYYVLPKVSKSMLQKKSNFLENNKELLGLINFEFVSQASYETKQSHNEQQSVTNVKELFEESYEMQDNQIGKVVETEQQLINEVFKTDKGQKARPAYDLVSEGSNRIMDLDQKEESKDEAVEVSEQNFLVLEEDSEMKNFMQAMKEPVKKPTYRGELFYDFKKYRTKPKSIGSQCCCIFVTKWKEHWNAKARFLAVIIFPLLFVYLAWHCARFYHAENNESRVISPDWYPMKNKILVNEKTQIDALDTKKWIEKLPMYEDKFDATYISTEGDEDFYRFNSEVFDYCENSANEFPWSYGSYQFYEMNEDRHQYKFLSYVNVTSPFAIVSYPQYMIESIMKNALQDDDFEIKFRQTPFPAPHETTEYGSFLTAEILASISLLLTMSDNVGYWSALAWQTMGVLVFSWTILNTVVLVWTMRDRQSQRKHYQEQHGQSKIAYWLAKFAHDLIFYLPISLMALEMIKLYDPNMEAAQLTVLLQPFATLPILYVFSHMFTRELSAITVLFSYSFLVQFIGPYLLIAIRVNSVTEVSGDKLYQLMKFLPLESVTSSFMFNSQVLAQIARFRENNTSGLGNPVETDENHAMNGKLDVICIIIHFFLFWAILILVIELRLLCFCCDSRMKKTVTVEDNEEFFDKDKAEDKADDKAEEKAANNFRSSAGTLVSGTQPTTPQDGSDLSSESVQIVDVKAAGGKQQFRFKRKEKPGKELAYKMSGMGLTRGGRWCCGLIPCCYKPKEALVDDLSAQIQEGSKFAIVSNCAQGKTSILNTLTSRRSAFHVGGLLKKQIYRGTPVYSTDSSSLDTDVLSPDLTLAQTMAHFVNIGSVHPFHVQRMIFTFGLLDSLQCLIGEMRACERHLVKLILALAGSARTVILDEPFAGLTRDQSLKLVKILRQKLDCTLIVTARSKAEIELLQPHQILRIVQPSSQDLTTPQPDASPIGYLLSLRIKPSVQQHVGRMMSVENEGGVNGQQELKGPTQDELRVFITDHMFMLLKLIGKKRSVVRSAMQKLMKTTYLPRQVIIEIAEMIHEDFDKQTSVEELVIKCQLIRSLFALIEALCKRFGEVHLEQRQDAYAVIRIVFNESCRLKGVDDSFTDGNPVFSSVLEFINTNDCMKTNTSSCQFLSSGHNVAWGREERVCNKVFCYSEKNSRIERYCETLSLASRNSDNLSRGVSSGHTSMNNNSNH